MSKICGIYKITSPSNRVYIGQSVNIYSRFNKYKNLNCKEQTRLYNSLKKYGFENHTFEVLINCKAEELNKYERDYQDLYEVLGINGLNCTLTKQGDRSGKVSEITRGKIILSLTGRKHSEESKSKISRFQKGTTRSEETKRKISQSKIGKPRSEDTKIKLRNYNKGRKHSEERNRIKSISFMKLLLNTQNGIFYLGLKEASNSICMSPKTLGNNLRRKNNNTNFTYV